MAEFSGKDNVRLQQEILRIKGLIERAQKGINAAEKAGQKQSEASIKAQEKRNARIVEAGKQIKANNQARLDALGSEEKSLKTLGSIYNNLSNLQLKDLKLIEKKTKTGSIAQKQILKIADINRDIAQLGAEDNYQREALINKRNEEFGILEAKGKLGEADLKQLKEQNDLAFQYSQMSSEQKDLIQKQHDVIDGMKKSIQGVLMTAKTLYGNILGAIGGIISGMGIIVNKVGKLNKEFGTSMFQIGGIAQETALLNIFFEGSAEAAKTLSSELGGTEESSMALKTNIGLMSETLGLSGAEAATLVGQFSRLNNGSTSVATDMIKTSSEFARQNNIIPSELMADLAASAEEFALFGEEGGDNILRAAGYAQKLGVNMKTLSGVAENLLDFESSITKELELGALLGRNINLNKARELAYSNDIEGATKETLRQLGGINAFNKMDYYQKKATADLLGISVAELSKMASNQEKAANLSKIMGVEFGFIGESFNYLVNNSGSFISTLGGGITALGQLNLGMQAMGGSVSGALKGMKNFVKQLFTANALTKAQKSLSDKQISAGFGGKKAKDMLAKKMSKSTSSSITKSVSPSPANATSSMGKINMGAVLKGAAAMLIMAGAVFVLGKALQEYKNVGLNEIMMAIGSIVALGLAMGAFGLLMAGPLGIGILLGAGAMLVMASSLFVLGHALQAISKGFGALGMIQPILGGLLGMVGGIFQLSSAFGVLAGSLALLGLAGISALPVLLGLAVAGAGLGFLINAVSGGGEGESSLPALPEETKQYYKDSLEVLGNIRDGIKEGSIIKMDRDVVGRSTSQSQSESGMNRAQFNK